MTRVFLVWFEWKLVWRLIVVDIKVSNTQNGWSPPERHYRGASRFPQNIGSVILNWWLLFLRRLIKWVSMSTQISVAPKEGPNGYFPLHVNIRVKPELLCIEEQKSFNKLSVLKRLMLNVGEQSRSNFINVKHKKLLVLRLSMVLNLTNLVISRLKSFETFVLYFFLFDT